MFFCNLCQKLCYTFECLIYPNVKGATLLIKYSENALRWYILSFFFFSFPQDALFFLKDFFSNLAAGVNPYLPVDPAVEGKTKLRLH